MNYFGTALLILLLSLSPRLIRAQGLTEAQRERLRSDILEAFSLQSQFDFQFQTQDIYKAEPPELSIQPARQTQIDLYQSKLNGQPETDAPLQFQIGSIYERLYDRESAQTHYQKAIDNYRQLIERDKTNVTWFSSLGEVYSKTRQFAAAERVLTIALELDAMDSTARVLLPTIYMMTGQFEDARKVIDQNLKQTPLDLRQHTLLTTISVYEFFSSQRAMPFGTDKEIFLNMPIDSIINLDHLKQLTVDHPEHTDLLLLYQLNRQMALLTKALFTFSIESRKFTFNEADVEMIQHLRAYHKNTLKEKGRKNKFVLYHSYAFTLMLENKFDEAIGWCKKALKARTKAQSTLSYHTGQVYDNMISCHLLLGDTAAAMAVVEEKISDQPSIDASPSDHVMLARFQAWKGNYQLVEERCREALTIDTFHVEAWTGLAFNAFMAHDYKLAENHINTALQIDDTNLEAGMMFAFILLAQGEAGSSKYLFERLLQLNPDDAFLKDVMATYFEGQ